MKISNFKFVWVVAVGVVMAVVCGIILVSVMVITPDYFDRGVQ